MRQPERPVCVCHGEPMYVNNSDGGWRCAVRTRARNNQSYAERGWKVKRLRDLASARASVIEQLEGLDDRAVA